MGETNYPASLCPMCKQIFEGEWVEKVESRLSPTNDDLFATGPPVLVCENESNPDSDSNSQSDTTMGGVEWYESPDWVKKIVPTNTSPADLEDTTSTSFISPQHHSLIDLDYSSISGCHLCTFLNNIVAGRLEEIDEADFLRAIGVVIVRPHSELSEAKESIVLAISYFLDGVVAQDAYLFGIEVLLLPHQGSQLLHTYVPLERFLDTGADKCTVEKKDSEFSIAVENSGKIVKAASLRHIQEWLLTCSTNHGDCSLSTAAQSRLPTRLLHVRSGDSDPVVSICETNTLPSQTRYLALSHCWGSTPIIRLLKNNYEEFKRGIDFNSLSRTFQDAVKITLALNQQYIWIDSLCIIQDSAQDWQFEASLMCSVYSNSLVTIAATASKDGSGGLFRSIDAGLARNCIVEATWTGHPTGTYICVDENLWDRQVVKAPLNTRGWVLQESILSPRIIHFAEDQIWWSCAQTNPSCNESFPNGVIAQDSMNLATNLDPLADIRFAMPDLLACNKAWLDIVGAYTQRALSFSSDKLVALAGIAEACASIMEVPKDSYLAGFWRSELIVDLMWRMLGNGNRPLPYRAPSWSWASVDGAVLFCSSNARDKIRSNIRSKVIGVEVTPVGDPLGAVSGGYIILQGPLLKAYLSNPDVDNPEDAVLEKLEIGGTSYASDTGFTEVLDHNLLYQSWPETGKDVYFACLTSTSKPDGDEYVSEGLILEKKGESAGVFRRIGWMRIFHPLPFDEAFYEGDGNDLSTDDYLRRGEDRDVVYQIV